MTDTTNETTPTVDRPLRRILSNLAPGRRESQAVQAVWNGAVIAESDDVVVLEGNHYFPIGAVKPTHLRSSGHHTVCPWKGAASYYDLVAGGDVLRNGAWFYATPSPAANKIAGRLAFAPAVAIHTVD